MISKSIQLMSICSTVNRELQGIHLFIFFIFFIYKLRTQCHTIIAETVQNSNRHWRRPTQVLKHLRVALKHINILEDLHPLGGKNVLNMCDLFEDDYKEFVLGELTVQSRVQLDLPITITKK